MEFLRNKISEEDDKKSQEEKEEAPFENDEQDKTAENEMDIDIHGVDGTHNSSMEVCMEA